MEARLRILSPSSGDDLSVHAPAYWAAAARAALTEHVPSVSNAIRHKPEPQYRAQSDTTITDGGVIYRKGEIKAREARSPRSETRCSYP